MVTKTDAPFDSLTAQKELPIEALSGTVVSVRRGEHYMEDIILTYADGRVLRIIPVGRYEFESLAVVANE